MKQPYTILVSLTPKSPSVVTELDAACKANENRYRDKPGFIGRDGYRCQQTGSHLYIQRWESEAAMQAGTQDAMDCPVGKLIEAGKVDLKHGPVDHQYR